MQLIRRETQNVNLAIFARSVAIAAAMPSERAASALQSGGLPFVLGYMHVNGPAGRAAQKATHVILLCRHGGEKQTSSNRRDRL